MTLPAGNLNNTLVASATQVVVIELCYNGMNIIQ